jgi:hypothetical protein
MFQRITFADFIDAFRAHGREAQFSYEALDAMFKYLEEIEEDTGEPVELDVIALCCGYEEADVNEIIDSYGLDASGCKSDDDRWGLAEKYLDDHTNIIWSKGDTFLYRVF